MNFDKEENNKQIKTVLAELPPVREAPIACHGTVKSGSSGLLVIGSRPAQVCKISSKTVRPVGGRAFSDAARPGDHDAQLGCRWYVKFRAPRTGG